MLFSETLKQTRSYDKLQLLWQHKFNDKHIVSSFAKSLGIKIPKLYCLTDDPEYLPILDKCVIKPTKGASCKNVFLIKNGINLFDNKPVNRDKLIDQISIPVWKGSKPQFICEEYLEDEFGHDIPIDYKFYIFGGEKIGAIHQIRNLNYQQYINRFYDENFNPIEDLKSRKNVLKDEIIPAPKCFGQMKQDALKIAKHIGIFVRVDMYATTKGSYFGETTFYPGNAEAYTSYGDEFLGDIWRQYPDQYPEIPFVF